ncbi:hypothetical protein GCM10027174_19810 [Salinifilum aidingensis]
MLQHLWWELGDRAGGACFEVELRGSPARVCLMDVGHYQAYLDSDEYEFHGGFCDFTPVALEVPYDDHWFLVVDSYDGKIKANVREVFDD